MDSSAGPTYGEQGGSPYNDHFGCSCYHPLFVFNRFGRLERYAFRSGNVHSAEGCHEMMLGLVAARYQARLGSTTGRSTDGPDFTVALNGQVGNRCDFTGDTSSL